MGMQATNLINLPENYTMKVKFMPSLNVNDGKLTFIAVL